MTGEHHNKLYRQSGQAFLIIIMFVSIAITVALATSFKAITETQVTKSQEDSSKAVVAADAGAEYALKNMSGAEPSKTYADIPIAIAGVDGSRSIVSVNVDPPTSFLSPPLKKDGQYTFYWAIYDNGSGTFGSSGGSSNGILYIDYGSASGANCNDIALEISLISTLSTTEYQVDRYVADTGNLFTQNIKNVGTVTSNSIQGTSFNCRATFSNSTVVPSTTKLIIVRYLTKGTSETRLGFSSRQGGVIPSQGKIVTAQGVTTSGIKRVVTVLQTYPQIPAEFFVTSF